MKETQIEILYEIIMEHLQGLYNISLHQNTTISQIESCLKLMMAMINGTSSGKD